ncbi:unnamed protein product [Jaminaea pallidilutea]
MADGEVQSFWSPLGQRGQEAQHAESSAQGSRSFNPGLASNGFSGQTSAPRPWSNPGRNLASGSRPRPPRPHRPPPVVDTVHREDHQPNEAQETYGFGRHRTKALQAPPTLLSKPKTAPQPSQKSRAPRPPRPPRPGRPPRPPPLRQSPWQQSRQQRQPPSNSGSGLCWENGRIIDRGRSGAEDSGRHPVGAGNSRQAQHVLAWSDEKAGGAPQIFQGNHNHTASNAYTQGTRRGALPPREAPYASTGATNESSGERLDQALAADSLSSNARPHASSWQRPETHSTNPRGGRETDEAISQARSQAATEFSDRRQAREQPTEQADAQDTSRFGTQPASDKATDFKPTRKQNKYARKLAKRNKRERKDFAAAAREHSRKSRDTSNSRGTESNVHEHEVGASSLDGTQPVSLPSSIAVEPIDLEEHRVHHSNSARGLERDAKEDGFTPICAPHDLDADMDEESNSRVDPESKPKALPGANEMQHLSPPPAIDVQPLDLETQSTDEVMKEESDSGALHQAPEDISMQDRAEWQLKRRRASSRQESEHGEAAANARDSTLRQPNETMVPSSTLTAVKPERSTSEHSLDSDHGDITSTRHRNPALDAPMLAPPSQARQASSTPSRQTPPGHNSVPFHLASEAQSFALSPARPLSFKWLTTLQCQMSQQNSLVSISSRGKTSICFAGEENLQRHRACVSELPDDVCPEDVRRLSSHTVAIASTSRDAIGEGGPQVTLLHAKLKQAQDIVDGEGEQDTAEQLVATTKALAPRPHFSAATAVAPFLPVEDAALTLTTGGDDGAVYAWSCYESGAQATRMHAKIHRGSILAIETLPKIDLVVSGSKAKGTGLRGTDMVAFDGRETKLLQSWHTSDPLAKLSRTSHPRVLDIASLRADYDQHKLYDLRASKRPVASFGWASANELPFLGRAAFHRNYCVQGCPDGVVRTWDLRNTRDVLQEVQVCETPLTDTVMELRPEGNLVITLGGGHVWKLRQEP